jgi:ribosome-associated heat shock protein Hsp15
VREGDVLTIPLRGQVKVIRVEQLPLRRGPASEARQLYSNLSDGPLTSEVPPD